MDRSEFAAAVRLERIDRAIIATMQELQVNVRLDVWLWAARFFKTRSLAKHAVEGGKVQVNDQPCKPAKALHVGDRLQVTRGAERFEIQVIELAEKRGSGAAAQALYVETEASRVAREMQREQRRMDGLSHAAPPSRPDKKSRRLIRGFKDSL